MAPFPPQICDRSTLMLRRARADREPSADGLFLHRLVAEHFDERLTEVNRSFTSPAVVTGLPATWARLRPGARVVAEAETLALKPGAHDLLLNPLTLHWANDPVGQLIQFSHALRPDGLMLAACFGGRTLWELRDALTRAEAEATGGASPRVAPMGDLRDLGALLARSGLALPVADIVPISVTYKDIFALMRDLRSMAETNALSARLRRPTARRVFDRADEIYRQYHPAEGGRIMATFELVFLTGWRPHPSQQKPLRPGSAATPLAAALARMTSQQDTH